MGTETKLTPRELAAYHTMMVYREAVTESLKALAPDHDGPCCKCREQAETARGFLTVADTIADVSAELAAQR